MFWEGIGRGYRTLLIQRLCGRVQHSRDNEVYLITKYFFMPDWLKAIIAGYGAKKLGGGCFSTILIFIVIYYALGTCNRPVRHAQLTNDLHRQTATHRLFIRMTHSFPE
jgi:hypothetical protein